MTEVRVKLSEHEINECDKNFSQPGIKTGNIFITWYIKELIQTETCACNCVTEDVEKGRGRLFGEERMKSRGHRKLVQPELSTGNVFKTWFLENYSRESK